MKIAGLDLSMSCPAITIADLDKEWKFENFRVEYLIGTKKYITTIEPFNMEGKSIPKDYKHNEERWHLIADWVVSNVKECEYINLESQSFGSIGSALCQISEMHGVVKNYLYKNNINIILTPPSQNKKSFSGKGNATKLEMIESFKSKYKLDLLNTFNIIGNNLHPVEDIVDSVALVEGLKDILGEKNA